MSSKGIIDIARKPVVKILTRIVLYGTGIVLGWLSIEKASGDQAVVASDIATGIFSLVALIVGGYIDKKHDKKDKSGE